MNRNALITCSHCGAKNRIPLDKSGAQAKCGRCHQPLTDSRADSQPKGSLTLRCPQCRTRNRVPAEKLYAGAKCGKCGRPLPTRNVADGRAMMVSDANFDETVLHSPLPVLLYAWSPQCSVCSSTGPMVDRLAFDTKGKVRVGKLNTNTNPALAAKFDILSVPSFFIFDAGQLKKHIPGAVPKHELMMQMGRYI